MFAKTSHTEAVAKSQRTFRGLHLRDLGINLSLANLCFFRVWYELESYDPSRLPAMKWLPTKVVMWAAMLNVVLLAVALTLVVAVFRRRPDHIGNVGRIVFVGSLMLPAFGVYRVVSEWNGMLRGELIRAIGPTTTALVCVAAIGLFCGVVWRWHASLARWGSVVLLMFLPGVALTFGHALWTICTPPSTLLNSPPTTPASATARRTPRVLWILFDEWDYRLTFDDRKAGLRLPEIDRLAQTTLFASDAIPPARATIASVPMLLSGERYLREDLNGPTSFQVSPIDEPERRLEWSSRNLIFSVAKELGYNTAVAGWYIPYCRVLSNLLNACEWYPMANQRNSTRSDDVWRAMAYQQRSLLETSLFSPFGQSLTTAQHVRTYKWLYADALQYLTDPQYGLVFVHMSIPHSPFIYDRARGTLSGQNSASEGYYDNLALLDRTIGEFRRKLEEAGQWDSSTILFTTDHYFRSSQILDGKFDFRVPFLLKLAGQNEALRYSKRFNTLVTKSLLSAVLRQQITSPTDAAAWIEAHGTSLQPLGASAAE